MHRFSRLRRSADRLCNQWVDWIDRGACISERGRAPGDESTSWTNPQHPSQHTLTPPKPNQLTQKARRGAKEHGSGGDKASRAVRDWRPPCPLTPCHRLDVPTAPSGPAALYRPARLHPCLAPTEAAAATSTVAGEIEGIGSFSQGRSDAARQRLHGRRR